MAVRFNPTGGKFDAPQRITLTAPAGGTIYYTLDGSTPNSSASRYNDPINVDKVAVIRAVTYVDGRSTGTVTQSYFCDRSYDLPIVSIATNPANLWDYSTGIYVKGCCADTIEPYMGANFWRDWEKWANIEMYETNGDLCFNQQAGISLFGGFSRMLPQKSLAVIARSKYGNNRFEYPIFPERDLNEYKSFIIRNSGGDFRRTHLRDAFMTQLAAPTGIAIQAYRPAVVFLNGEYWGIQNLREKINEHYLEANFDVDKDNVDILRHNGVARHGTSKNYKKLLYYLRSHDLSKDEVVDELRTFMDVDDFIRYNIAETYSDNRDAGGNIRYWRERNDSAKWRWVFYDLDLGLGNNDYDGYKRNTLKKFTSANGEAWPDPAWSTFIIRSLLKNKKLEVQYINTFADHLNTVYEPKRAEKLWEEMQAAVQNEMKYHVDKWSTSIENWEFHLDVVREFIKERPAYLRQFIVEKFELAGTLKVTVVVPDKKVATVTYNSLGLKGDFEGIYFQNVPVTITVSPTHDYIFKGWKNRPDTTRTLQVSGTTDFTLEPILEPKPRSVHSDSIIFNELCMFQIDKDTTEDWFELYNRSKQQIDVSHWVFTKSTIDEGFVFPANATIAPGGYLVVVRNKASYGTNYSLDTVAVIGNLNFGLAKEKEAIKLYDNKGLIVDSLRYKNKEEMLDTAFTLSLVHPDSARHIKKNWVKEPPTPGGKSRAYKKYLNDEADKARWTKIYYIGGGSFFFILASGLLLRLYFKRRKKSGLNKTNSPHHRLLTSLIFF